MEIVKLGKAGCKTKRDEGWIDMEMAKRGVVD
jgi:hypothetical protein